MLDTHYHTHNYNAPANLQEQLNSIFSLLNTLQTMSKITASDIQNITTHVQKIGTESAITLEKVSNLEKALEDSENDDPAVTTAFEELKAQVQVVDDLVPDAPAGEATGDVAAAGEVQS